MFSKLEGMLSKRERILVSIPLDAVLDLRAEGLLRKRLVILVDGRKVPGIPRHEFDVPDPFLWIQRIREEIAAHGSRNFQPGERVHIREVIREVVKVPCKYCGALVESTARRCHACNGPLS